LERKKPPVLLRMLILCLVALLPACATVTSGTTQAVSLISEPPGAICEILRDGATVGVVNPTPGTVQISKSSRDIQVNCNRLGSLAAVQTVRAEFQGMTAGNILLGGVIGLAVDAASGAMSQYPATVSVVLPPDSFASVEERDAYFTQRIADTRRLYEERVTTVRGTCPANNLLHCDTQVGTLETERDTEIARLEGQKATVRTTQQAMAVQAD
jgi:hypothetical protein